jgi:hypothetical protein
MDRRTLSWSLRRPLMAPHARPMITEEPMLVTIVVPPRKNLLNGVPDVLVVADPLRLLHGRALQKDRFRVGVFNPPGQIGMHHGQPPFRRTAKPLTRQGVVSNHSPTSR